MAKSSKRGGLSFLFIIMVLIIGYATNPTEEKFREYIKQEINNTAENEDDIISEGVLKIFSGAISNLTPVEQKNYYVFSMYRIDVSEDDYVFIGAFNHFFRISK